MARHGAALYRANAEDAGGEMWTYLSVGPFESEARYLGWRRRRRGRPLFYAIVDGASGAPLGLASYLRIDPANGVIEVAPAVRPRPADAGGDRGDVPDDAPGLPGAGLPALRVEDGQPQRPLPGGRQRYGFRFEGIFRQAVVYKGRSRDTAWYSILDSEWPAVQAPSSAGSTRPTSMRRGASAGASPICDAEPRPGLWHTPRQEARRWTRSP